MKKYRLTEKKKEFYGTTLYRIKALKDFRCVKKGELGGWIEKESNLSQEDECWVYGHARVLGDARVSGFAEVSGYAKISGHTRVSGHALISGHADVSGFVIVSGDAHISGHARVLGDALVRNTRDHLVLGPVGENGRYITITKSNGMIRAGCFHGDFKEFRKQVNDKYPNKDSDYHLFLPVIKKWLNQ